MDRRSDVFSLGVVLYELLTRQRPFPGRTVAEILRLVAEADPRPPRQCDATIPRELERICLKALAGRATERYATAHALADDLEHFLVVAARGSGSAFVRARGVSRQPASLAVSGRPPAGSTSASSMPMVVIPRGLRSFDADDADFFLSLLPGPRDRNGLPESIHFWKSGLEQAAPDAAFPVGVLYGPSGCGKSSLVKAGLLPRLSASVIPLYIEATAENTEARVSAVLLGRFPAPMPPTIWRRPWPACAGAWGCRKARSWCWCSTSSSNGCMRGASLPREI